MIPEKPEVTRDESSAELTRQSLGLQSLELQGTEMQGPEQQGPETILIAEDDPMFRRILQRWVESWGFGVVLAEDGNQAWEILRREQPPQLLILDWVM
ncbi:MAG: response regulator, partial [Acidobacteriaceae bacterium]